MNCQKMDLSTLRLYGSIAVILGCFLFLYPQLMHPLIMTLFGMNKKPSQPASSGASDLPPHLREKAKTAEAKSGGMRDDLPDHIRRMRSGPHPGMRAAAAEQSKETRGSGKGMMGVILPMYAVGIVVYLVYTLFKVFNKKDEKGRDRRSPSRSLGKPKPKYEESGDYSEDEGRVSRQTKGLVTPQDLQNELESLVHKVQDKNLNEMDMRKLQERLAETEAQMSKILAAMQAVQGKVDVAATAAMSGQGQGQSSTASPGTKSEPSPTQDTSNNQGSESAEHLDGEENKKADGDSSQSSPGSSESYEIVNKPDKESPNAEVETLQSNTTTETTGNTQQNQDDDVDDVVEPEEVLMEEKKEEEDENVTVRQRLTKKEETDS